MTILSHAALYFVSKTCLWGLENCLYFGMLLHLFIQDPRIRAVGERSFGSCSQGAGSNSPNYTDC